MLINNNIKDEIYFVSMHCFEKDFYPGTGNIDENNEKVLNIPFPRGRTDENFIDAFDNIVKPYIKEKSPNIIVISNGLDAHKNDPFRVMKLTNNFYKYVTSYLKSLSVPLIYILEGGYKPSLVGTISEDILTVLAE